MNDEQNEIQQLHEENERLKSENHELDIKVKLMLFFAAVGVCYLIEPHSIIAAAAIGIGAFYFCFIR